MLYQIFLVYYAEETELLISSNFKMQILIQLTWITACSNGHELLYRSLKNYYKQCKVLTVYTKLRNKELPVATYSGAAYPWVPITWVDTWVLSPVGPAFAKPKSESLGLKSCNSIMIRNYFSWYNSKEDIFASLVSSLILQRQVGY